MNSERDSFLENNYLDSNELKAFNYIAACGSDTFGFNSYRCEDCGVLSFITTPVAIETAPLVNIMQEKTGSINSAVFFWIFLISTLFLLYLTV